MTTAPKTDQPPAPTAAGPFRRWVDVWQEVELLAKLS
jgi:hypothetical protein